MSRMEKYVKQMPLRHMPKSASNPADLTLAGPNSMPVVRQPRPLYVNQRAKFIRRYVCSTYGFVRLFIIVLLRIIIIL